MSPQKSVLVIDDDKALSSAIDSKFSHKGYRVVVCDNGPQGFKMLDTEKFDVVLTDLHMPEQDGFAVLRHMKDTKNSTTPAYVITNLGSDHYCDRALEMGAKKCFVKSVVTLIDIVNIVDAELCA
ncbi:hypothetical protein COU75_00095 [Candidatus Peregrinibacteria bacterium CG10_big_fil_rev_8_21_14_0_10_42_8]|nr:MAG: hypothetical protein COU75_00095 [Candidatus Peregrinibacteria bacterium CG10_big_fil_rev_8_21_14_0_10_42_8]